MNGVRLGLSGDHTYIKPLIAVPSSVCYRLKSLSSTMGGRYGHRVAFDPVTEEGACSALHLGEVSCDLPVFRLVRDGLVVDEYHGHGNHMFEEELHKRIEAALSLSRKDDSCE